MSMDRFRLAAVLPLPPPEGGVDSGWGIPRSFHSRPFRRTKGAGSGVLCFSLDSRFRGNDVGVAGMTIVVGWNDVGVGGNDGSGLMVLLLGVQDSAN